MKKVLVVNEFYGGRSNYYDPFRDLGDYTVDDGLVDREPESIVCAVFTGGADVNPVVYGHRAARMTSFSSTRDQFEIEVFKRLRRHNIPLFGICRGAQLLCALAGGTLCQHLDHHAGGSHAIETSEGKVVRVNSFHHQMQLPPQDAEILAWSEYNLSRVYVGDGGKNISVDREYEVVHYPNINALGVQYHPEMMFENSEGWKYYQDLIHTFMRWQKKTKPLAHKLAC